MSRYPIINSTDVFLFTWLCWLNSANWRAVIACGPISMDVYYAALNVWNETQGKMVALGVAPACQILEFKPREAV